jgi:hypothetical protein
VGCQSAAGQRFYTSGCPVAARLQKLTCRPSVVPSGTSGAASALSARGGDLRDTQEYGTGGPRVFLLFETSGAVRKLRRLEASPHASKPKISRLAYLPSSHPPCEISGTRHVSPGSARPENVPVIRAEQRSWWGPARYTGVREYGRSASFLVVRDVRRRTKTAQARSVAARFETPNSRLAYLPSSHPPCEISGTRHVSPGSARPENVPVMRAEQRYLETPQQLLQFELRSGSTLLALYFTTMTGGSVIRCRLSPPG